MRNHRIGLAAALLFAAQIGLSSCIEMPEIKDRVVDLVATQTVTLPLNASGSTNLDANSGAVDLGADLDVAAVLDDAGIDVSDVKSMSISAVSYRIVRADVTANRAITGSVQIAVGAQSTQNLISVTGARADAVTGWITPTLGAAAVGQLNTLLNEWLGEIKGTGPAPASKVLHYSESGTSTPAAATDFDYEVRLTISIVGSVKAKILS